MEKIPVVPFGTGTGLEGGVTAVKVPVYYSHTDNNNTIIIPVKVMVLLFHGHTRARSEVISCDIIIVHTNIAS